MPITGLGPFNNIIEDFKNSLNSIFGQSEAFDLTGVGSIVDSSKEHFGKFKPENWTGNTNRKGSARLRYGFTIVDIGNLGAKEFKIDDSLSKTYYLDIPPQAITQKENFATNISATRRGVVVESEGVIFKDIVISGTTGVFPGTRESYGGARANFKSLTSAPNQASGVEANGTNSASEVISGYAEFLGLRAFFLKFADAKVKARGNLFLVFINEKDQQALVVEPLEFTMERNSKNPMQYQYRIVLKAIMTLDNLASQQVEGGNTTPELLNSIINVSRNAAAAIQQFRAAVGQANRLVQTISQELDKTLIGPLRLLGSALQDVADARENVLRVPTTLQRNLNDAWLTIQEQRFTTNKSTLIDSFVVKSSSKGLTTANNDVSTGKISTRGSTDFLTSNNLLDRAKAETFVNSVADALTVSALENVSKSFVEDLKAKMQNLADDIAEVVNLGNADYDLIRNRSNVFLPNPLRSATSSEYLLLGSTLKCIAALNSVLATNNLFAVDTNKTFEDDETALQGIVQLSAPSSVKEITILGNDTLERISVRYYGTVDRWVEIAVLNNLKYPYIADTASDGVKKYGDKLLIGN